MRKLKTICYPFVKIVEKDLSEDEKILEAICTFYKFYVDSQADSSIFLKTTKKNSVVRVYRRYNQYTNEMFTRFLSIHAIIDMILNWADRFGVYEDENKIVYVNNVFLGCKNLEDVLIARDLHSDENFEL